MVTPLILKSIEVGNTFYFSVLKYKLFADLDPYQQKFVVNKSFKTLFPFNCFIFMQLTLVIGLTDVIYKTWLTQSVYMSFPLITVNVFVGGMVLLCLLLIIILLPNAESFYEVYFNKFLKFDSRVVKRSRFSVNQVKLSYLIQEGMPKLIYMQYKSLHVHFKSKTFYLCCRMDKNQERLKLR